MPKISIIIPNWNGADKLRKNIPAVLKAAKYSDVFEVIIVDDGSTDESVEIIKNEFPEVKLINKSKNSGFSSTVNLGVSKSKGEIIVLLNNDARPEENFLKFALPHFEKSKVFSVGCNVGGSFALATFRNGFFWHNQADEKPTSSHLTLWVSGGSGIFRKKIWDELEGLDTLYDPFYEEDLDIGYRAMKRGYLNIWEPKSEVDHYREEGVIAKNFPKSKIQAVAQRNQLIFIWKNITSPGFTSAHKKALLKMLAMRLGYWPIFLSAFIRWPEIQNKRNKEKRESKLTDEEVLAMF